MKEKIQHYKKFLIVLGAFIILGVGVIAFFILKNSPEEFVQGVTEFKWIKGDKPLIQLNDPEPNPVSFEFGLVIPRIGVNAPIVDNVDGSNENDYLWKVKEGVAHFKALKTADYEVDGSYPDKGGNIFIFGHSQIPGGDMSKYQGVFNQLPDLQKGDKILIYYQGKRFEYGVEEGKVIEKTAFEYLSHTDAETLTLMTCWPLGFENKRYIIRAKRT